MCGSPLSFSTSLRPSPNQALARLRCEHLGRRSRGGIGWVVSSPMWGVLGFRSDRRTRSLRPAWCFGRRFLLWARRLRRLTSPKVRGHFEISGFSIRLFLSFVSHIPAVLILHFLEWAPAFQSSRLLGTQSQSVYLFWASLGHVSLWGITFFSLSLTHISQFSSQQFDCDRCSASRSFLQLQSVCSSPF